MMAISAVLPSRRRRAGRAAGLAGLVMALTLLSGCDYFFGDPEAPPLPGQRISVLKMSGSLVIDPTLQQQQVVLPKPETNTEWPQPGGYASNAMYHLAAPGRLRELWSE
ncbi:MAG: pyrrolo-quinoline quinone, partial [Hypericibacter sp.]